MNPFYPAMSLFVFSSIALQRDYTYIFENMSDQVWRKKWKEKERIKGLRAINMPYKTLFKNPFAILLCIHEVGPLYILDYNNSKIKQLPVSISQPN